MKDRLKTTQQQVIEDKYLGEIIIQEIQDDAFPSSDIPNICMNDLAFTILQLEQKM